jgi:phosphate transport system substrate-binding protein
MKKPILLKLIFFLFAAALFILPIRFLADASNAAEQTIQLRGSETVMGMLQPAAEAYMVENPRVKVAISGGGTDRGIKSLIDGTCQIAMASSEINEELIARAADKGSGLVKNVIAYDAVVPFVHPDNPVSDLTIRQLRQIYTGEIQNWKEVGGSDAEIVLTTRGLYSGTYEAWKLLVMGKDAILPKHAMALDSIPEIHFVAQHVNAIGFSASNHLNASVKPLTVEGVPPTAETIENRSFPLIRDLVLLTRDDAPGSVNRFIDYVIENEAAFDQAGIFPVK